MVRRAVLLAVAWGLLGLAPAGSRAAPLPISIVSIAMFAEDAPSVVQGKPFAFIGTITNPLPLPMLGRVDLSLVPPDGSPAVALSPWIGSLAASGSADFERTVNPAQFFASTGDYRVAAAGAFRLQALSSVVIDEPSGSLPFTVTPPPVAPVVFEDVTAAKGITTTLGHTNCSDYAQGAAWGDVNGDGRLDLYIPQRDGKPSELWISDGDTFVERAAQYGVTNRDPDGSYAKGAGAIFVDFDNDGDLDLFVTNDGVNKLYRNNGDATFTNIAPQAGLVDDGNFTTASWADYDADGYLDLFVGSHGRRNDCFSGFTEIHSHLYHNNGNGTFTESSDLLPYSGASQGLAFVGTWMDYNNDGRPDLYLSNDHIFRQNPMDRLWRNDGIGSDGRWRFTDVSLPSGAGIGINAMGAGVGDYNRDGNLDVAQSNIGPLALMRNNGDGTFTNDAVPAGIARTDQSGANALVTWALGMEDFNNDGWDDLYVAAGALNEGDQNEQQSQPNQMFVNDGTGHFLDLSAVSKADDGGIGRGIAFADYDGDGKMDMLLADLAGGVHLYHNVTATSDHWAELHLSARGRDACGAHLEAEWPGKYISPMTREVSCGSTSMASGSDPTVHFGLGSLIGIDRLTIRWPNGTTQVLNDVAAGARLELSEP